MADNKNNDLNENSDNENKKEKKKPSAYGIFRIVMIVVLSVVCLVCVVKLGNAVYSYVQARQSSNDVMSGFENISKPEDNSVNNSPITNVPDDTKNPESSDNKDQKEPQYSEYFLSCLEEIKKMKEKYKDFVGFLEIEDLNISYPIVQGEDNEFYLNHLINGNFNQRGEIFMDFRNDRDSVYNNKNIVLYGHNLADGTKFHNLLKYKDPEKFKNADVKIITEEGIFTYKVFSFYKTDARNPYIQTTFQNKQDFKNFCINEQNASMHKSNFEFTGNEYIITLSTCVSYFGGRWCTHAVLTDVSY